MISQDNLSLLLPEGMLGYFRVTGIDQSKEGYPIYLEERNSRPEGLPGAHLISNGFFEAITVQDFPLHGKACYLKVRRRRWPHKMSGKTISRDWEMVAKGTWLTAEFASFFKGILGSQSH